MVKKHFVAGCAALLVALSGTLLAQPPAGYSEHGAQESLIGTAPTEAPAKPAAPAQRTQPAVNDSDWVVMGYVQGIENRFTYHWHALTHICIPFTDFDSNGDLTNATSTIDGRSIIFQPNGMADRHGVKVIMTLRNAGFSTATLDSVMQTPANYQNLATQVAAIVNDPSDNIAGVNLDFEPVPYSSGTGQGIVDFIDDLRSKLNPGKEISYYVGPTFYSGSYPNLPDAADDLDFFNISCYPYSGSFSSTSTSITPLSSYDGNVDSFMANGVPPEKMVLTLGAYGFRMETSTDTYGASKLSDIGSTGFADAKFEVTYGVPQRTRQYQTGAESPWFAFDNGSTFDHWVYEDEYSVELKMRNAQSWLGSTNTGMRLGGVAFWSLAWMSNDFLGGYDSYDLESSTAVDKIRTYPHLFQEMQEVFSAPGDKEFLLEKWEYYDSAFDSTRDDIDRWREPLEGNDDTGVSSATRANVTVPAGAGQPVDSAYCERLSYTFTATPSNKFFYRWEILADEDDTTARDFNATRGFFDITSKVMLDIYTPSAYANTTVSMVFLDADGELEKGPALSLNSSGWRTIETDLQADSFTAYNTTFNQYFDGDGTVDHDGSGTPQIAFIGLLVENGGASGSGQLYIDELRYTHTNPGGNAYTINEFSYLYDDGEFIEIHGPTGSIPAGTVVNVYTSSDGSQIAQFDISGLTIPANGVVAIGDPSVSGVASSTGFSDAADDIRGTATFGNQETTGLQIVDTATGGVYDSVVYEAFGGIEFLVRPDTLDVSAEGYPWLGEIGMGQYALGRFPDGADSNRNNEDFASLPLTPGLPNTSLPANLPVSYDFDSTVPSAFQAYDWASAGEVVPGVFPSTNGGNVYRVADSSGGNVAFFTDPLTEGNDGYQVTGEIYITGQAEPSQAIGIGICGTLGSTFFEDTPAETGYENGYWLIYHNDAVVDINTGLGNHAQTFKLVSATNDNMDGTIVEELASVPIGTTSAVAGVWNDFLMEIDPAGGTLRVEIAGSTIYNGAIPAGGRTSGAFQVGHREDHAGGTASNEGTWIDGLTFSPLVPAKVNGWMILQDQ